MILKFLKLSNDFFFNESDFSWTIFATETSEGPVLIQTNVCMKKNQHFL